MSFCDRYSGIKLTDSPIVNAGDDVTMCETQKSVQLSGTVSTGFDGIWLGGNGTFTPNRSDFNALYNPTATEIDSGEITLTLQSANNGTCTPVIDDVLIIIQNLPTVTFPNLIELCADQPSIVDLSAVLTNASSGIWTGSDGTFLPSNTTVNVTYQFSVQNRLDSTVT